MLNPLWRVASILLAILVIVLLIWALILRTERDVIKIQRDKIKADYTTFVTKTRIAGEQAVLEAKQKEQENATRVSSAMSDRDAALAKLAAERLRKRASGSSGGKVPLASAPSAGSSKVCPDSGALASAMASYRGRLTEILGRIGELSATSDAAQIDAEALLKAWPE